MVRAIAEYIVPFTRLIIAISAVDSMASPLMTIVHATGNIRLYQFSVGTVTILNIPISYVFLRLGYSPLSVFYISLLISIVCLFMRLWIVRRLILFPVKKYIVEVLGTSLLVCAVALVIPLTVYMILDENVYTVLFICILCIVSSIIAIYYMGLNSQERKLMYAIRTKIFQR